MTEKSKVKIIDISAIRWGFAPAPLFPRSIRQHFGDIELPGWVAKELQVVDRPTVSSLGPEVWNNPIELTPRLRHFLLYFMRSMVGRDCEIRCFDYPWPTGLRPTDLSWSVRTRNRLSAYGLFQNIDALMVKTFRDLYGMDGAGSQVVLELTATTEGAIDFFNSIIDGYSQGDQNEDWQLMSDALERAAAQPWSYQIGDSDPRFAVHLSGLGRGTLHELIENTLSNPEGTEMVKLVPRLLSAVEGVSEEQNRIERLLLEESLAEYMTLLSGVDGDRLSALLLRFGWSGKIATLEEAGAVIGVTRERMRQLQQRVIKKLPEETPYFPKLDMAIETLERAAPISIEEAETLLLNGICAKTFTIEALLETAQSLKRRSNLRIRSSRQGYLLVTDKEDEWVGRAYHLARRLAGKSGVSSVFQVQAELETMGYEVGEEELHRVLSSGESVEFLNDAWFWVTDIPTNRNRLRNVARKILSVVSPQTITSVRDGVRRNYAMRASSGGTWRLIVVPPLDVMRTFFERHPEFEVIDGNVKLTHPEDYRNILGDTDRVMVDVLRSAPAGVLDRYSFTEGCLEMGMNENTFSIFSSYSCVVEHVGMDLWKLRGSLVDSAAIEAYRSNNNIGKKEKRNTQHGWGTNGELWIAAEIPRHGKVNLVIYLPKSISRFVSGQTFEAIDKDRKTACGNIVVNEIGNSYGYGIFIRRSGLDENDVLLVEFDISKNRAYLSVGREDLLFEMENGLQ